MADTFPFRLITPTGIVMEGPAEEVIALSSLGEFGVLAQHIDFVTSLIPGLVRVRLGLDRAEEYVVMGGLAAVKSGAMTILAPEIQTPAGLDRSAVADELTRAEEQLGSTSFYQPEYEQAEYAVQVARARSRAAELKRAR